MQLINWCAYYHNILMGENKPNDWVFEHDALLDEWVKNQEGQRKHRSRGGKSALDHQEIMEFE